MIDRILDISKYFYPILFFYSALSKLLAFDVFVLQLGQSPLIPSSLVPTIGFSLIIGEFIIFSLFLFERTISYGLVLGTSLMFLFTVYLITLVSFFTNIPCSCGGILGNMSYTIHIIFNIVVTFLGFIFIKRHDSKV